MLETALDQEMTELGHEKNGPVSNQIGNDHRNVWNGTRAKTVLTDSSGEVGIEVPRDRAGTFEPQIVRHRCPDQVHAITGTFGQQVLGVLVQDTVQDRRRRL